MRVLGFSVGHDKGAVIIENGKVLIGITQERLSRVKHDGFGIIYNRLSIVNITTG